MWPILSGSPANRKPAEDYSPEVGIATGTAILQPITCAMRV